MPHRTSYHKTWAERTFFTVFILVWSLMASIFTYIFLVRPITLVIDARGWATVPCEIVYSKVNKLGGVEGGVSYGIEVLYDYAFEGKQYQSSHYEFPVYNRFSYKIKGNQQEFSRFKFPASNATSFSSRRSAQKALDLLQAKSKVFCYVNPDNPSEATLLRGLPSYLWWGLIPLVFLLLPAGCIYVMLVSTYKVLIGRRWKVDLSRIDDDTMKRQVLRALLGTGLVLFCILGVLFAIAWRNVHSSVFGFQAITLQSIAKRVADFQSNPQHWRRVSFKTARLSANVTRQGGRNETVYRNPDTDETLCIHKVFKAKSKQILKYPPVVAYDDDYTEQIVEEWASEQGFIAEEQICLHLAERFDASSIRFVTAEDHGDFLALQVWADCWEGQREFVLMPDGAISW